MNMKNEKHGRPENNILRPKSARIIRFGKRSHFQIRKYIYFKHNRKSKSKNAQPEYKNLNILRSIKHFLKLFFFSRLEKKRTRELQNKGLIFIFSHVVQEIFDFSIF